MSAAVVASAAPQTSSFLTTLDLLSNKEELERQFESFQKAQDAAAKATAEANKAKQEADAYVKAVRAEIEIKISEAAATEAAAIHRHNEAFAASTKLAADKAAFDKELAEFEIDRQFAAQEIKKREDALRDNEYEVNARETMLEAKENDLEVREQLAQSTEEANQSLRAQLNARLAEFQKLVAV